MSVSIPMQSNGITSFYPAYTVSCADSLSQYVSKKEAHQNPSASLDAVHAFQECVLKCKEAMEGTPCVAIQKAYGECISSKSPMQCKSIQSSLEQCVAKHIGKLD